MKYQGRIKKLMDVRSGVSRVGNAWRSQDFIFEYFESDEDRYSETVLLSVRGEKIEELALREGEEVVVDVRCVVKTYGERIYNEVYARSVEKVKAVGRTDGGQRGSDGGQPGGTAGEPLKANGGNQGGEGEMKSGGETAGGQHGEEKEDDMPF